MDQVMEYCFETDLVGARVGGKGGRGVAADEAQFLPSRAQRSLLARRLGASARRRRERRKNLSRPLAGIHKAHATPYHRTAPSRFPSYLSTYYRYVIITLTPPLPPPNPFRRPPVVLPPAAAPACFRRGPRLQPHHSGGAPGVGQHQTRG